MCTLTLKLSGGHNKPLAVSGLVLMEPGAHPQVPKGVLASWVMECRSLDCDSGIPVLVRGVFLDVVLMTATSHGLRL